MNKLLTAIVLLLTISFLVGCGSQESTNQSTNEEQEDNSMEPTTNDRHIRVQSDEEAIIFQLNDSTAANELYNQLPLTVELEDFGSNEKIFYPPEKLNTANTPTAVNKIGCLAYYEPWGDVVIFYDSFSPSGSLYELGEVVAGEEFLGAFSGNVTIEVIE
ncbi:cyclophilin-like fold protein [Enterococcus sp. AZ109]|uniref:cyclophilin-like fold protein n=1 Tax=Enterococcus sp. AZ109 TaxID=2774634 RepID=UPI003F242F4B